MMDNRRVRIQRVDERKLAFKKQMNRFSETVRAGRRDEGRKEVGGSHVGDPKSCSRGA